MTEVHLDIHLVGSRNLQRNYTQKVSITTIQLEGKHIQIMCSDLLSIEMIDTKEVRLAMQH